MKKYILVLLTLSLLSCVKPKLDHEKIFNNVLVLGSSITLHAPYQEIGWTGNWGMAASSSDKDYYHLLLLKFKSKNPDVKLQRMNLGDFEVNFWKYDFSQLEIYKDFSADLVILNIGDNVDENQFSIHNFGTHYEKLINHFKTYNPNVNFVFVSSFWGHTTTNKIIKDIAKKHNLPYVSINELSSIPKNTAKGLFEHPGVSAHPSDLGMQNIANKIWEAVIKL